MEFVLGSEALSDGHVYLFSAGGNNPDVVAAHDAATARGAGAIHVVTSNAGGELAGRCVAAKRSHLHILPIADSKDGFLATHSLMSAVTLLLNSSYRLFNRVPYALF